SAMADLLIRRKFAFGRHRRLLGPPLWQKFSAAETVDLGKNRSDRLTIAPALDRLQQHGAPDPAHAHLLAGQAELLRQPHRLTAAVHEEFGGGMLAHECRSDGRYQWYISSFPPIDNRPSEPTGRSRMG